jgi:hypothetical protein
MQEDVKPEPIASRGGGWFRLVGGMLNLGVEMEFSPKRKARPVFCAQNLDHLGERLEEAAFPVIGEDSLPNWNRFYATDPFGNRIEFIRDGDGFGQKG